MGRVGDSVMNSVSSQIARAIVVTLLVSSTTGCIIEGDSLEQPGVKMVNNTDVTLEIRYLSERTDLTPEGLERLRLVTVLKAGGRWSTGFPGYDRYDDGCLDAAMVALRPDGTEMDRVPAGTCAPTPNGDIHWEIIGS